MSILLGVGEWISGLLSIFPKLVYFITMSFLTVLDLFQFAVRKLAGLDTYYINGTSAQTGDIALSFIRAIFDTNSTMPAIKNAFWSLIILGIIMLVISTIVATIRSEYSGGDNNKSKVIASAVKSLFMFLIVPVSVLFGLMISDVFLIAIDKATSTAGGASTLLVGEVTDKLQANTVNGQVTYINYDIFGGALPSNTQTLSGIVFQTAAFNANRVRTEQEINGKTFGEHLKEGTIGNLGIFQNASSVEERAKMIDEAFAHNVVFDASAGKVELTLGAFKDLAGVGAFSASDGMVVSNMSKFNVSLVWVYYDLWMFNYVIAFAFIYALMKVMTNIVMGLMKRLIELVALFMISPPIVAVMPLDGGKTFNKWRENFLARALSAVGVILGFNLFFLLLPYIQQINFLDPKVVAFKFVNMLINTVLMIVALQSIESMIAIISKMVGADDPNKAGGPIVEKMGDAVKQAALMFVGAGGAAAKFAGGAGKLAAKGIGKVAGKGLEKLDKKFMGGKMMPMAKAMGAQLKNDMGNLKNWATSLGRGKEVKETKNAAEEEWKGVVDNKYNNLMKSDETYKKELQDAYQEEQLTRNYAGSFDDFMADGTKRASDARAKAEANYSTRFMSRDDYKNSDDVQLDKQIFVNDKVKEKHAQIFTERKGKAKAGVLKAVKYAQDNLGGAQLKAMYKDITGEIKSATIRGGKGGLKAMMYAFNGLNKKQMGAKEKEEEFAKEEKLKDAAKEILEAEKKKK